MALIFDNLRRRIGAYGNRKALRVFRLPLGYSGSLPGAVLAEQGAKLPQSGLSKAASAAENRVLSVVRERGLSKEMSVSPIRKAAGFSAGISAVRAARKSLTGGIRSGVLGDKVLGAGQKGFSGFSAAGAAKRALGRSSVLYGAADAASRTAGFFDAAKGTSGGNAAFLAAGLLAKREEASGDGSGFRVLAAGDQKAGAALAAPVQVEMINHNQVSSELDLDRVVSYLADRVAEGLQTAAEAVHW